MKWRLIMIRLPPPPSEEGSATRQLVRFGNRQGSSGYELLAQLLSCRTSPQESFECRPKNRETDRAAPW